MTVVNLALARDIQLIGKIADRAVELYAHFGFRRMREAVMLELRVCHEMIMPLRLQELLDADDLNFSHDISGISRHLRLSMNSDGSRACLSDCFVPRFAERKK
jgi:hypothetical protein